MEARRPWNGIFNVLKEKYSKLKFLYLAKLTLKIEGVIKTFFRKAKGVHYLLYVKMSKGIHQVEMKEH